MSLLNEAVVALECVEKLLKESIRKVLKSQLKPWLKQMWCTGTLTGEYLANMEDVLDLYA